MSTDSKENKVTTVIRFELVSIDDKGCKVTRTALVPLDKYTSITITKEDLA